ncbi:GDSL-type esterase/lipase family protein [Bacillus solimangrovi]|uniref:SGNH hydrolase-type esterase domain-containing protein n=1 Tax=Bacillus solimangrovi TaxID=1305675 RepID=A0A1E5LI94_9BACI|nr:GDSL-type esterase/lipase family protein [Bacillus solimangrovi]OEH93785.1 hypothetical protein BFG57_11425 [Bacillus solimangrovi]
MSLYYVALGDSLTVGVGTTLFTPGFVYRYANKSERHVQEAIFYQTCAETGATSKEILDSLNYRSVQRKIRQANIITITAGGNDLIQAARIYENTKDETVFFKSLSSAKQNMTLMINKITALKQNIKGQRYIIRILNLYNPLPTISVANKWIDQYNHHLSQLTSHPHVLVANINRVFKGHEKQLLSKDHIHPNDLGYERMAIALEQLGYRELMKPANE